MTHAKHKHYTAEQRAEILLYATQHGFAATKKRYGTAPSVISKWRKDGKAVDPKVVVQQAQRGLHEVIALLTQARAAIHADIRSGHLKRQDRAHLLMQLALNELTGGNT